MNALINDGGAAFPMGYHPEGNNADHFGMTLRDYFAAAALQGFCAKQNSFPPTKNEHFTNLAEDSFKVADAMIKVREAK
jgi:hypothetical protein